MASQKLTPSKIFMWILMGLLFVGLAGFGATNLSGTVRNIGTVGDKSLSTEQYGRALQQEIRAIEAQTRQALPFQQALEMGLPEQVLARMVTLRALDHEAGEMGLSVGDAELVRQLRQISAFAGPDGAFDRDAYRFALQNANLSEAEFEADLRDETARTILQGAVLSGNAMPDAYVNTLLSFALENRTATWTVLDETDLTVGISVPGTDELRAHYEANIDAYSAPQTRDITYVWITPDMIVDTVTVDDALLRESYEERAAEFNQPERRLVERLVFPDQTAAQTAADQIAEGTSDFEAAVTARGLDLSDTDLGDITREDLQSTTADAVFAADAGNVVGPLPTDLGPALFRVNAVLPAQVTSFEDARAILRNDLALDRARRVIETMAEDNEDRLAGGFTLEELAADTELRIDQIDWHTAEDSGIAAYPAFREAAAAVTENDFPSMLALGDGGLFALRLNGITPSAARPYDAVADQVASDWERAEILKLVTEQAQALADRLNEGVTFDALGLTGVRVTDNLRRGDPLGTVPSAAAEVLFDLTLGQARAIPTGDSVVLVQLNEITAADTDSDDAQALAGVLRNQAASDLSQDMFNALVIDIQRRAGVQINDAARTAVHSNFQ